MPFKSLKNHLSSLATSVVADKVSNFMSMGKQKDAGKVAAQLLDKSPFDIPNSPSAKLRENPLSFSAVQYPLDLGSEELGHYIIFESGFLTYQPQQDNMFEVSQAAATADDLAGQINIDGKIPKGSITTSAISIYMPPSVKVNYNQSYDNDQETGISGDIQEAIDTVKGAEGARDKILGALNAAAGSVARQGSQFVGEFISLAGMGDPVRFTLKRFGTAINPRNEALYNTPTQRTFSFTFDFWPRNQKEAQAVENIITIFKYNSAPGFRNTTGLFATPNYFKIKYMHKTSENTHLNRIGACFCTDVSVDYSPDGQFSTFESGQPVHTRLTVSFLEDRIVTKRDIEAGA